MFTLAPGRFLTTLTLGLLGFGPLMAQPLQPDETTAALRWQPAFESHRERLPDERAIAPSLAAPALAAPAQRELSQVGYRFWASRGRYAIGVGVGAISYSVLAPAHGGEPARLLGQQVSPALTLGWRVRLGEDSVVYGDTSTTMPALGSDGERVYFSTRGGVEWKLSESRFGFDRGRLAMRLDSGYRMSLRLRGGGVGFMLRGQF